MFGLERAPELTAPGQSWFNVDAPLTLAALRGKVVILDFWTFCCVNCFHALPTLRQVEERFGDQVAVIGVHSPKFTHEQDPAPLAQAIARYDVSHPVVHDPGFHLWDAYCVRAWPTLVLISPDGRIIGQISGEPHPDLLPQGIARMVDAFFVQGRLRPRPLPLAPMAPQGGRLRFPGKIKPCRWQGRKAWVVADSGHHQVVVFDDFGAELARFGNGRAGAEDGANPSFNGPEGVAAVDDALFVADTRNHLIRRIDPDSGAVTTVAGMGWRGGTLGQPMPALDTALASPWDLTGAGGILYFANAGSHQLGWLDLANAQLGALAGSGAEALADGGAGESHLAQPSGLALADDGVALYFADAETSAIRHLCLDSRRVATLAGQGLFDFGHHNGPLDQALLQHPLGLALAGDGRLFVADSYNDRIRVIDPAAGRIDDLDLDLDLAEPAGLCADGGDRLLVADTNAHRILEVDTRTGHARVWTA